MSVAKSAAAQWVGVIVGDKETDTPAGRVRVEAALVLGGLAATWRHTTMDANLWGVTHLASGRLVTGDQRLARVEAVAIVRALQGVADWTKPEADLLKDRGGLSRQVHAAIAKALAETQAKTP